MSITFRANKGTALTYQEMDVNLGSYFYSSSLDIQNSILRLHYTGSAIVPVSQDRHEIPIIIPPDNMANNVLFGVNTTFYKAEKLVYDPSQNRVGVGTVSPTHTLHVSGSTKLQGPILVGNTLSDVHYISGSVAINTSTPTYALEVSGSIRASDNIIAYSDIKLKSDINVIPDALEKLNKLSGNTYIRSNKNRQEAGLIAQELKEVLPEVVFEDREGLLGVDYNGTIALIVEAVKELTKKLENLEK